MAKKGEFLEYKGRPLVRCGNTIYYGSMADPFVVCLKVQSEKKQGDQTIADKVIIQLLNTDEQISPKEQVVKKSEKTGLFNALDLGAVWLERASRKTRNPKRSKTACIPTRGFLFLMQKAGTSESSRPCLSYSVPPTAIRCSST